MSDQEEDAYEGEGEEVEAEFPGSDGGEEEEELKNDQEDPTAAEAEEEVEEPAAGVADEADDAAEASGEQGGSDSPAAKKRKRDASEDLEDEDVEVGGSADAEAAAEDEEPADAAAAEPGDDDLFDSDAEGDDAPRAEDRAFIDDEGAEPASDGEQAGLYASEAEEEDNEIDRMLNAKKKRGKKTRSIDEIKTTVEKFITKMETAALADQDANLTGKPAINKLKMLSELETMLSQRDLQSEFLDAGLLGVLKLWIEPLQHDGSLPNVKVRSTVLKVLQGLPLDVSDPGRKQQLKASELGKVVMFLFRLPDETPANRRMAKELVEKWSRPIFEQYARDNEREVEEPDSPPRQRRPQQRQQPPTPASGEGEARRPRKPTDPGWRWHASIPEPARLDYTRRPQSRVEAEAGNNGAAARGGVPPPGPAAKDGRIVKKLKRLAAKGTKRAGKVSVEGRGIAM